MTSSADHPEATMQASPTEEGHRLPATQEIGRIGINAEQIR